MTVRVVRDLAAPMRHEIHVNGNHLATDASVAEGGEDSAPNAHDLFDAALGACKALTVVWYANRKKIPVRGVEVLVESDRSQERAGSYRRRTQLTLSGELTDAQREELLRVASKCPVHKLLTETKIEITTALG